jgi:hypothetical protein
MTGFNLGCPRKPTERGPTPHTETPAVRTGEGSTLVETMDAARPGIEPTA